MSDAIEIRDGQANMMYAGETPWHGLGIHVENEVTAAAAIKLAGLDWICEKRPLFTRGQKEIDGIPVIGTEVSGTVAVVRVEDGRVLGIVSPKYSIIQNNECFDFIDTLVGSGEAVFHTAGSLFGGSIIFCTVKLPNDAKVGDDLIEKYLLLATSHNRKLKLTVQWTPVRVVCANTLNVAMRGQATARVEIRHTRMYGKKVEQAREVLKLNDQYYQVMETQFNRMLDAQYTEAKMAAFTETLFPSTGEETAGVTKNKRAKLVELFQVGAGNEKVKNTRWAAFNAVTEYADHFTTVRAAPGNTVQDTRMNSATFGGGLRLKQKAFDLLNVAG